MHTHIHIENASTIVRIYEFNKSTRDETQSRGALIKINTNVAGINKI